MQSNLASLLKDFRLLEQTFLRTIEEKYLVLDFALTHQSQEVTKLINDWLPYKDTLNGYNPLIQQTIQSAHENVKELMRNLQLKLQDISQYMEKAKVLVDKFTKECSTKMKDIQGSLQSLGDYNFVFDDYTTNLIKTKQVVLDLVFEPIDQLFIASTQDGSIVFYNQNLQKVDEKKQAHESWIRTLCVQFSSFVQTKVLLSAGDDQTIGFWLKQGKTYQRIEGITYKEPKSYVRAIEMMQWDDGREPLVFAGRGTNDQNAINVHKWNNSTPFKRLIYHQSHVKFIKCIPKLNTLMSFDDKGCNVFWSLTTFNKLTIRKQQVVQCMDYNIKLQLICLSVTESQIPKLQLFNIRPTLKLIVSLRMKSLQKKVQFINPEMIASIDSFGQINITNYINKQVVFKLDCSSLNQITSFKVQNSND